MKKVTGYFESRPDRTCNSIYLIDRGGKKAYTLQIIEHTNMEEGYSVPSTDIDFGKEEIIVALAEALQKGGYIPQTAVDTELKATRYHLEDMRNIVFKVEPPERDKV